MSCGSKSGNLKNRKTQVWNSVQVVDEFGDNVEGKFDIGASFNGKMSNSITTGVPLIVNAYLHDSTLAFVFYEYEREPYAQLPDSEFLRIKIKTSSGELFQSEVFLYQNLMLDNSKELLGILLNETEPLKIIVDLSRYHGFPNKVYMFELNPNGLQEALIGGNSI